MSRSSARRAWWRSAWPSASDEAEIDGPALAAAIDRARRQRDGPIRGAGRSTVPSAVAIVADLVRERFGVA